MHPSDASVVVAFTARLVDGAAVLGYPPREAVGLRCTVEALRAGLAAGPGTPMVALVPDDGADDASWRAALAAGTPAARAVPVTDAVKRVADGLLAATVDRTPLRLLTGPAVVPRAALDALVAGRPDDDVVHPLEAADAWATLG